MHSESKSNESIAQSKTEPALHSRPCCFSEYLYQVMKFNKCSIPEEVRKSANKKKMVKNCWDKPKETSDSSCQRTYASLEASCRGFASNSELLSLQGMYMIRFHSFYPWHSHSNYMNLCNDKDLQMLPWVQEFKLASLSWSLSEM